MKKSLPLLIGSILCANAVLHSLSAGMIFTNHADRFQKLLGISVAHAEEAAAVKYTCPMHPQIISDTPGKCPICGMDLVPIAASGGSHTEKSDVSAAVTDQKIMSRLAREKRIVLTQITDLQIGMANNFTAVEFFFTEQDSQQRTFSSPRGTNNGNGFACSYGKLQICKNRRFQTTFGISLAQILGA